jgi:CheY-like chemotaxis protein
MDIQMPGMDGVEVMRRLKATPRLADIAVIMVTGQSDRQVVTASMKTGAAGFVVKPFERGALLAKVVHVLKGG